MASLDSLPADQRAVLQLVLQRGRTYDEIARLLSIDRAAVRARALAALDALGPQTRVGPERRALITDYLLGQLPHRVRDTTRDRLAESASERAWARVLSAELAPIASGPLPDIPMDLSRRDAGVAAQADAQAETKPKRGLKRSKREREPRKSRRDREPKSKREREPRKSWRDREPKASRRDREPRGSSRERTEGRRISRRGGAVLLVGVLVVLVVGAVALLNKGGAAHSPTSSTAAARPSTTSTTSSAPATPPTSAASTSAKVISQVNLSPPSGHSKAAGIAEVLQQGATEGVAVVAQHVTPNATKPPNAYAVWLYNSPSDAHILGFVNPGVGQNGRLSTAGGLPTNAAHFRQLIVTLETSGAPKTPGTIVLQGKLTGVK
jgi:Sigma-70, region 4